MSFTANMFIRAERIVNTPWAGFTQVLLLWLSGAYCAHCSPELILNNKSFYLTLNLWFKLFYMTWLNSVKKHREVTSLTFDGYGM